jgi:hypothetical protein
MYEGEGEARTLARRLRLASALLLGLFVGLLLAQSAWAQPQPARRIALVIGNATYTHGGVLDNPEADAELVATKLGALGFEVTTDKNLGQSGMRDLIGGFMSRVRDGDLVLIYYAGHGIEADGRDYMLPVDVKLETPASVQFQGIPLDMLYSDKQTFGVIIVFDACRDNPFIRRVKGSVAGAHALSPPVGALVLFSASAGDVAEDGGVGADGVVSKNSVFASAFVRALAVPDASIQRIYQTILRDVRTQTSNRQAPQRFGDLAEDFTFNASTRAYAAAPTYVPAPAQAPPPAITAPPLQVAANTTGPAGTVYRSLPTPEGGAAQPATTASAPRPSLAIPTVEVPIARTEAKPEPQQVASLTATAPPPPSRPAAVAVAPAQPAAGDMRFTIASLGENVMPPPPQLEPVPAVNLPEKFCSVESQIAFLNDVFRPAYNVAYRNNDLAVAYLSALNALGAEYNARQSGFVFRIKAQFEAFAPVAARANQASSDVLALDAQIRRIPVQSCAGGR